MFNFTESPTDYLKTRRESLKSVIKGMQTVRITETNQRCLQNLTNGLFIMQNELTDIDNELLGRGELVTEQLHDGTIVITEKKIN